MSTLEFAVSERQSQTPWESGREINVGKNERLLSMLGGGALVVAGLSRRSLPGLLLAGLGAALIQRGATGRCAGYGAMGISTANEAGAPPHEYFNSSIHVEQSMTVARPASELYAFWRNFENLPTFMRHLKAVHCEGDRSHWVASGPGGVEIEWDAEIINDEPDALIAWRSLRNADVDSAGSVRFLTAPGGQGTEVRVVLDYIPPAGRVGSAIAKVFGKAPEQTIREDLRRFKQVMETGEVATTAGQSRGDACR